MPRLIQTSLTPRALRRLFMLASMDNPLSTRIHLTYASLALQLYVWNTIGVDIDMCGVKHGSGFQPFSTYDDVTLAHLIQFTGNLLLPTINRFFQWAHRKQVIRNALTLTCVE